MKDNILGAGDLNHKIKNYPDLNEYLLIICI